MTVLPVFVFLTVVETVNALPATALPTISLLAANFGAAGGGGGGGGGGGAGGALTVMVLVVEAVAPESSVTVSLAVNVPAAVYWWLAVAPVAVPPSPNCPGVGGDLPVRICRLRSRRS